MPDKFDPYREALIMEATTVWPEEFDDIEPEEKERVEGLLQAAPEDAAAREYVRVQTGFCSQIPVTEDDRHRVQSGTTRLS